jgi:hypothetical protein
MITIDGIFELKRLMIILKNNIAGSKFFCTSATTIDYKLWNTISIN